MAAIAYTLVAADPCRLTYSFTGDAAGDLTYAVYSADLVNGPLKDALTAVAGETDSDAKALAALVTGGPFTGASGATRRTHVQATISAYTSVTTAKAPVTLAGKDSGAGNNPDLRLTPDAATAGVLVILYPHSIVQ